jgi:hypothetical protein
MVLAILGFKLYGIVRQDVFHFYHRDRGVKTVVIMNLSTTKIPQRGIHPSVA